VLTLLTQRSSLARLGIRVAALRGPARARGALVNPLRGFHSRERMKEPRGSNGPPWPVMVEAAGIEPASASPTLQDLRAYPAY
jgi:hypothetical protein